jgi:hypothetical protein
LVEKFFRLFNAGHEGEERDMNGYGEEEMFGVQSLP